MPNISTDDLSTLVEAGEHDRLIVARSHNVWLLFLVSLDGKTRIHANLDGRHNEYSHVWQVKEWLADRFGITEIEVEYRPWQKYERS